MFCIVTYPKYRGTIFEMSAILLVLSIFLDRPKLKNMDKILEIGFSYEFVT